MKTQADKVNALLDQCEQVQGEPMQVKATSKHRLAGQMVRYVQDSVDGLTICYFQNGILKDIPKSDLEAGPKALGNK